MIWDTLDIELEEFEGYDATCIMWDVGIRRNGRNWRGMEKFETLTVHGSHWFGVYVIILPILL